MGTKVTDWVKAHKKAIMIAAIVVAVLVVLVIVIAALSKKNKFSVGNYGQTNAFNGAMSSAPGTMATRATLLNLRALGGIGPGAAAAVQHNIRGGLTSIMPIGAGGAREHLKADAPPDCPAGTELVESRDPVYDEYGQVVDWKATGQYACRPIASGEAIDNKICKAGWDDVATLEAQALAANGAIDHSTLAEERLQGAISAVYDSRDRMGGDDISKLIQLDDVM